MTFEQALSAMKADARNISTAYKINGMADAAREQPRSYSARLIPQPWHGDVRRLRAQGVSIRKCADELGLTLGQVANFVKRERKVDQC